MLGIALLPVLASQDGLFSRINHQRFGPKAARLREPAIGLFGYSVFALALVTCQHLVRY